MIHISAYCYGEGTGLAGVRIGVTRHVPLGIRRTDYSSLRRYDLWMPLLASSRDLLPNYLKEEIAFKQFVCRYRGEMKSSGPRGLIELIALIAQTQPVHLGCFCTDECSCHRSVLREIISAAVPDEIPSIPHFASPPCFMEEF